jgi:hypothetical protein
MDSVCDVYITDNKSVTTSDKTSAEDEEQTCHPSLKRNRLKLLYTYLRSNNKNIKFSQTSMIQYNK